MTETIYVDFVYANRNPTSALERIAEWFGSKPGGDVQVVGPRERFGVTELRLTHSGQDPSLVARLEANPTNGGDRSHTLPDLPAVEMHVTVAELIDDDGTALVSPLLDLVRGIYEATNDSVEYVYGLDPYHVEAVGEEQPTPVSKAGLADGRIDDVTWLMLFSQAMVEGIGRERFNTLSAWTVREFDDGGCLVVATSDPTDPNAADYERLRTELRFDESA